MALTYPDTPAGASVSPVLSASADGFHITGVPAGPTITDMLIEGRQSSARPLVPPPPGGSLARMLPSTLHEPPWPSCPSSMSGPRVLGPRVPRA